MRSSGPVACGDRATAAARPLRGGHRRRRLARPGDRLLPDQARDHRRLRARAGLHRLGRGGAQHGDPALQLPDRRRGAFLRAQPAAVRRALGGARLQPDVLPARPPDARARRPQRSGAHRARRAQPAARNRQQDDRARRDREARPADAALARCPPPGSLGALPPARRHDPPRRRGLGARPRRRSGRRRDPPRHHGHRNRALARAGDRGARRPAARSRPRRWSAALPGGRRRWPNSPASRCRSPRTSSRRSSPSP